VLKAATHGVADAYRSHGRGVTVCAEAVPTVVIATAKKTTIGDRIFPSNDSDLSCMGCS